MPVILVADRLGPFCVSSEDGAKLCALIRESLDRSETVTLDFAGVTTLASLFLNNAIGCLYGSYNQNLLEQKILWSGLDPADESVVTLVKRNAIRFYDANGSQQEALSRPMPLMEVHQNVAAAQANGNGTTSRELPVADFMEPVEYGWTEAGYEARQALKKYCEDTHADY